MARTRKESPNAAEAPPADPPPVPSPPGGKGRKWLVQFVLPLAAGVGLTVGLVVLGDRARDELRQQGEHTSAFADIECDPPEGLTRQAFLEEAQYLANLPDRFNLLDPDVNARISAALSAHPWVAEVKRVEQLSPGRVRAELAYRVPVLIVVRTERAVDREGVLLPRSARQKGLPVLRARVRPPVEGPGRPWADDTVTGAAVVAGLLLPHLQALKLQDCTIDLDHGDLVLATAGTRVVWGRPPGRERPDEVHAEQKLRRLLEGPALQGREHDLRPADGVKRRMLER